MSIIVNFFIYALITKYIICASPITSTCKYGNAEITPLDESDCTKEKMNYGDSCCYVQYKDSSSALHKVCMKYQLNQTITEDTIKTALLANDGTISEVIVKCPQTSIVPNNCGLVGTSKPSTKEDCSGVSLPESYCCFVKHSDGASCRRLDYFADINGDNKEVKKEVEQYGVSFISVVCSEKLAHYFTFLSVLTLIFVGLE